MSEVSKHVKKKPITKSNTIGTGDEFECYASLPSTSRSIPMQSCRNKTLDYEEKILRIVMMKKRLILLTKILPLTVMMNPKKKQI